MSEAQQMLRLQRGRATAVALDLGLLLSTLLVPAATRRFCACQPAAYQEIASDQAKKVWDEQASAGDAECFLAFNLLAVVTICCSCALLAAGGKQLLHRMRGPFNIWQRLLLVTGLGLSFQPQSCTHALCAWLWHGRLLLAHLTAVVARVPMASYLIGAPVCCLAAALLDVAAAECVFNPTAPCRTSFLQAIMSRDMSAVGTLAAALLQPRMILPYMLQIGAPGLLLAYRLHAAQQRLLQRPQMEQQEEDCPHGESQPPKKQQRYDIQRSAAGSIPRVHTIQQPNTPRQQFQQAQQQHEAEGVCPATRRYEALRDISAARSSSLLDEEIHGPAGASTADVSTPAAAAAAELAMAAYHSPLQRNLVAIKLQEPPGTGAEELEAVRQRLTTMLQTALAGPAAGTGAGGGEDDASAAAAEGSTEQHQQLLPVPIVSQSTAFSGCYQLVFEIVRPADGGSSITGEQQQGGVTAAADDDDDEQEQLQKLQRFLEQQVRQQLPAGWQVRGIQMIGQQQQQQQQDVAQQDVAQHQEAPQAAAVPATGLTKAVVQSPTRLAAAADSLAAALACLWSRESESNRAITLQPLAVAMPAELNASDTSKNLPRSSTNSSSAASQGTRNPGNVGSTDEAVHADLMLCKAAVRQLLQQGHHKVRCVVALQPEGEVLLDQAWPLLSELAQPAAATTPEDPAVNDLRLHLKFSLHDALRHGIGHKFNGKIRVLSVVVLAKESKRRRYALQQQQQQLAMAVAGSDKSTSTSTSMLTSSKDGHSSDSSRTRAAAEAAAAAAVSGAAVPGVIAHLPLLLLPAGAAVEMQGVVEAAVAYGMGRTQANQQLLLRLVQDWTLLVLLFGGRGNNMSSTDCGSHSKAMQPPLQHMQRSLCDSLSAYFKQHNMQQCQKILQAIAGNSAAETAGSTSSAAARSSGPQSAPAVPQPSPHAAPQPHHQQQPPQHPVYSVDFYLNTFKIAMCTAQHPHDWSTCPFAHPREKARRRDPRIYEYEPLPCPDDKKGHNCPRGDACHYTHNVYEFHLHPKRFRTQMCQNGAACTRPLCFFAHSLQELRIVEPQPNTQQQEPPPLQQQQEQHGLQQHANDDAAPVAPAGAVAALAAPPLTSSGTIPPPPLPAAASPATGALPAAPQIGHSPHAAVAAAAQNPYTLAVAATARNSSTGLACQLSGMQLGGAAASQTAAVVMPQGHTPAIAAAVPAQPPVIDQAWLQQQLQQQHQQPQPQQFSSDALYSANALYDPATATALSLQQQQLLLQLQQQLAAGSSSSSSSIANQQLMDPRALLRTQSLNHPGNMQDMNVGPVFDPQRHQQQQWWAQEYAAAAAGLQPAGYSMYDAAAVQQQQQYLQPVWGLEQMLQQLQQHGSPVAQQADDPTNMRNLLQ